MCLYNSNYTNQPYQGSQYNNTFPGRQCSIAKPAFTTHAFDPMVGLYEDPLDIHCVVGHVLVGQATTGAGTPASYNTRCEHNGGWTDTTPCTSEYILSLTDNFLSMPTWQQYCV